MALPCFAAEPILPPLPKDDAHQLSTQPAILVRDLRFEGNTVFPDRELKKAVAAYLNRPLTMEQLEEVRRTLTTYYIERGYINSGAVLPDQTVADGIVTFRIVEGRLSRVNITGNKRLRTGYLRDRIETVRPAPLNVGDLRDRIEILRQNPNVERINAELKPSETPGQSILDVRMLEANPWQLGLEFDNRRSPSIGSERFTFLGAHQDVTGNSDALAVRWGLTRGDLDDLSFAQDSDYSISYSLPFTRWDTALIVDYTRSDEPVTEEPFRELNIASETESWNITLRQPLYRTPNSELALFLIGAERHNQTWLNDEPFSFSLGAHRGESQVTALRFGQEFSIRDTRRAITLRSVESFGLDILGATENPDGIPDSQFFAWLGQFQYVTRLLDSDWQLMFRTGAQLTPDRLLSVEQFGIGGMETVRGYRENQLVRDQAVIATAELRIPLIRIAGRSILDLAPFMDLGYGWNAKPPTAAELISSAGVGLLFNPNRHITGRLYWGHPFKDFDNSGNDLQDMGIHFDLVMFAF